MSFAATDIEANTNTYSNDQIDCQCTYSIHPIHPAKMPHHTIPRVTAHPPPRSTQQHVPSRIRRQIAVSRHRPVVGIPRRHPVWEVDTRRHHHVSSSLPGGPHRVVVGVLCGVSWGPIQRGCAGTRASTLYTLAQFMYSHAKTQRKNSQNH